jgi:hypothetical protein
VRDGVNTSGPHGNGGGTQPDGRQLYRCAKTPQDVGRACWRGVAAAFADEAQNNGIDKKRVRAKVKAVKANKRYIITAAQNATPVHKGFWKALEQYAEFNGAEIVVIPYRYKNPTSIWSEKAKEDDWWAPEVVPHLVNTRLDLNKHLRLLADIKTQPTATSPLSGFESISGARSAIIGHPKLELKTVPTPQSALPKIITTTGACTVPNYLNTKAGKKGEFHHTFGAAVVELVGQHFHLRQINALADGSFIDLDLEYSADGPAEAAPALALVMGDSHIEFIDPKVVKATFEGPDSMVAVLKPAALVWHDTLDAYARNHHHRDNPFIAYVKHHSGHCDNVEAEIDAAFAFVDRVTPAGVCNVFVASNHDQAIARWIRETDPRNDPENAAFWCRTYLAMLEGSRWTDTGAATIDPFAYWAENKLKCYGRSTFLARGESHTVGGIEVGYHGDLGANGARGSLATFASIGVKTITGHSHSPGIKEGAYRVGLNARYGLEYAVGGPSSWLQTDCVIYANGKRSLLTIVGDQWRAPPYRG